MREKAVRYLSSSFSIVVHIVLFFFFFQLHSSSTNDNENLVEVSYENPMLEEPGGGGGGDDEEEAPPVKKEEPKKPEKKEKIIPKDVISDKPADPKEGNKEETQTSGQGSGTGTGTGTGSGSGSGLDALSISKPKVKKESNVYFVAVDEMPTPQGGMQSIMAKLVVPPEAKAQGISGTVYILAYIDELGNVRKVLLSKGIGHGCDEAAANAVKRTKFKPGRHNGENVKVQMHIPVTF